MTKIVTDMSNEDYHKDSAVGASGLKLLNQSPLHYWARYLDPNREPDQPTPAMKLGTAVHTALLEPGEFDRRYVVMPEGIDRRSAAGKALFAEIEASGKEPLKPDQMDQIRKMQEAAFTHPVIRVLFSKPEKQVEQSMYWNDPVAGVRCKMRPDFMLPPGTDGFPRGLVMDLKTTGDASPSEFPRQTWNLQMHIQAAWYTDGFMRVFGTSEPPPFIWFAQENSAPFANKPYSASADLIEYGRKEYRRLVNLYDKCARSNIWPGYNTAIETLELPAWAAKVVQDATAAAAA